MYSRTIKIHRVKTPRPHTGPGSASAPPQPATSPRLPGRCACSVRFFRPRDRSGCSPPPIWRRPGSQAARDKDSEHLGIPECIFPLLTVGCVPWTLSWVLLGRCPFAAMKTKPVSHKTKNTHRVSERSWAGHHGSLLPRPWSNNESDSQSFGVTGRA